MECLYIFVFVGRIFGWIFNIGLIWIIIRFLLEIFFCSGCNGLMVEFLNSSCIMVIMLLGLEMCENELR